MLAHANQLDDWIAIGPDGVVTVFSGKVELGTGVKTALAQIVAEELDVRFEDIRMVMGDTALTPDEGYTAGSTTIRIGGAALRQASAEARWALLEMASEYLDADVDELIARDGVVSVRHDPVRTITYARLMGGKRFKRKIGGDAPVKRPEDYRIVGTPVARVDIPLKLTGAASFIQDLRVPGMLHGRVVRPPGPGATLESVDHSSVEDVPGLVQVVQLGNFVGVVAEREEQAVRAANRLKVTWRAPAHFPPLEDLYDYLRSQPATDNVIVKQGKVKDALKHAATRLHAIYYQPYHAHASIGPSCAVADVRESEVVVWCSTQGVFPLRGALAQLLDVPLDQVRVIHVEGAGCYGHNGFDDVAADAAILSRAVDKPVRVQWSREDEFAWEPYAPAMLMEAYGGLNEQGQVVAWDNHVWSPTHANRARAGLDLLAGQLISGQPAPARPFFLGGDRNAPTNYTIPNNRVTLHWLASSPLRASSFRSLGGAANTFANESFMDELAAAAHSDPLEFRLRHLSDQRAIDVLKAGAGRAGWGAPRAPGEGQGIAFTQYENSEAYVAMVAQVHVDTTSGMVRVKRIVVAHDCGLIINPDGLRNQIEGNIIQATSRALKEEVTFDEFHIASRDWETYPVLTFAEVPDVDIVLINRPDQPAVGAGEPSTVTVAPAIANAVFAATGVRLRRVPFAPKRVQAALSESFG